MTAIEECGSRRFGLNLPRPATDHSSEEDEANFAAASNDMLVGGLGAVRRTMLPALLGTAAGAAAVTIGRGAAAALGNSLSFAGELAKTASSPILAADSASKGEGGLPAALSQRISDLTERIRRHLAAAGVKLSKSVELEGDGLGGIAIGGDHPQQAAIERTLGEDVLLERDFSRLADEYCEWAAGRSDQARTLTLTVPAAP